jgi:hypothetical protein
MTKSIMKNRNKNLFNKNEIRFMKHDQLINMKFVNNENRIIIDDYLEF